MPISDDWDFDYTNKVLQHVDGVLSYDSGTGNQAAVGDYIEGQTSGATGKVIAVTGTAASGTLTLTNVRGLFEDNEVLEVLDTLDVDDITANNGGFEIGDTLTGNTSSDTIVVKAIEFNFDGSGTGTIHGTLGGSAPYFSTDEQLNNTTTGTNDVADASAVGTENSGDLTGTQTDGTLKVPGTENQNKSVIIHYDGGGAGVGLLIPEQAIVEDASTGALGLVEQQYGTSAVGSLRIVDYDYSSGVFTDNNTLRLTQVLYYDTLVAGKVFSVGDVVEEYNAAGDTKLDATGRVIAVVDDGDSTGKLVLADESGSWDATSTIFVDGVKIADVESTTTTLNIATLNLPEGIRTEQRPTSVGGGVAQGGIYPASYSLNTVRKLNSLYTLSQDTFDELLQMDDDEAMDAAFKGVAYTLVYDWRLEIGSERFLRKGGLTDTSAAEIWANPQTVGAQNKITSTAFLIDSTQTFRQPQLYIEQDGAKITPWWLEGQIDVLLKVKTRQDPRYINPNTPALGQLIPGGDPAQGGFYTVLNREYYTSTYDATEFNGSAGGVNTVALGTADDTAADRNPDGTHTMNWNSGSAATLLVGEEFYTTPTGGNGAKVGLVVAQTGDAGATGTLEYVLKSGSQFTDTEACTALVSGKTFNVNGAPAAKVAGYGYDGTNGDIRFNVVDIAATPSGGTGISGGPFYPGEKVTQAVTSATGYVVFVSDSDVLYLEVASGTFSGDNDITGSESGAVWDAGSGATYPSATTFSADLNNGEGAQPYSGSVSGDCEGAGAETMQNVYQWSKYLARQEEETAVIQGPGTSDDGTVGNIYRRLKDTYAEVKPGNPFGVYTGSLAFAQGWFLDTNYIAAADIRSFTVRDDNGVPRSPPNLQSMTVSGVANGWRVAAYRATGGEGSTTILRHEFEVGAVGSGKNQAGDSTVLVQAGDRSISPLPSDVPSSGVLRIESPNNTGNYVRMPYTAVDRSTNEFTLGDTIGNYLTAAGESSTDLVQTDDVHVAFIEEQASGTSVNSTIQYVSTIDVVFKARLKGYKPFISTFQFTSTSGSGGVVQTPDTIVDLP